MEKLARHEIEMQGNKHHYTICKERRKLVKTTRKLDEEERACVDRHWSITKLSLSLFSGLIMRKENYTRFQKILKKFLKFFSNSVTLHLA